MPDTQPPRRVAKPVTEQDAPDNLPNEGKTPAHGMLSPTEAIPYIRRKVDEGVKVALEQAKELDVEETRDVKKNSTIKTIAGAFGAFAAAVFLNLFSDCHHEEKDTVAKSALQQQLVDHIANEEKHYGETKELLHQLLDAELGHKR